MLLKVSPPLVFFMITSMSIMFQFKAQYVNNEIKLKYWYVTNFFACYRSLQRYTIRVNIATGLGFGLSNQMSQSIY